MTGNSKDQGDPTAHNKRETARGEGDKGHEGQKEQTTGPEGRAEGVTGRRPKDVRPRKERGQVSGGNMTGDTTKGAQTGQTRRQGQRWGTDKDTMRAARKNTEGMDPKKERDKHSAISRKEGRQGRGPRKKGNGPRKRPGQEEKRNEGERRPEHRKDKEGPRQPGTE